LRSVICWTGLLRLVLVTLPVAIFVVGNDAPQPLAISLGDYLRSADDGQFFGMK
jgi:hypothetical protein